MVYKQFSGFIRIAETHFHEGQYKLLLIMRLSLSILVVILSYSSLNYYLHTNYLCSFKTIVSSGFLPFRRVLLHHEEYNIINDTCRILTVSLSLLQKNPNSRLLLESKRKILS